MAVPSHMFRHEVAPKKGYQLTNRLDFQAKLHSTVTVEAWPGRIAHLASDGTFNLGAHSHRMSMILMSDPTSNIEVGAASLEDMTHTYNAGNDGKYNALVLSAALELQSTEFDTSKTYAVNDLLVAVASNTDQTTGGRITNVHGSATALTLPWVSGGTTRAIIGMASWDIEKGSVVVTNNNRVSALNFWAFPVPGTS